MQEYLSYEYFHKKDASLIDTRTEFRGLDCISARLSMILRNIHIDKINTFDIFLEDISFTILKYPNFNNIVSINGYKNSMKDIFKLAFYNGKGSDAISQLETMLNSGSFVFAFTYNPRVSFLKIFKGFDFLTPDYEKYKYHPVLYISQDKDNFYYVEAPWNINTKKFLQYENNKSVGVLPKRDLIPAASIFLNCIEVREINTDMLNKNIYTTFRSYVKRQCDIYYNRNFDNFREEILNLLNLDTAEGLKDITIGMNSMCFLKELCEMGSGGESIFLDGSVESFLGFSIMRRELLSSYFSQCLFMKTFNDKEFKHLILLLEENIKVWQMVRNVILKRILQNKKLFDINIKRHFIALENVESIFFQKLNEYIDSIDLKYTNVWKI